jgi:isocitrate dehydrogenase
MKNSYSGLAIPADGKAIGYSGGELQVPDTPIIPFIEGDGTGRDIWKASRRVLDVLAQHDGHWGISFWA